MLFRSELYAGDAPLLDELCLSTFAGTPLSDAQLADAAPPLPAWLTPESPPREVLAASGPWTFARYVRARVPASASI